MLKWIQSPQERYVERQKCKNYSIRWQHSRKGSQPGAKSWTTNGGCLPQATMILSRPFRPENTVTSQTTQTTPGPNNAEFGSNGNNYDLLCFIHRLICLGAFTTMMALKQSISVLVRLLHAAYILLELRRDQVGC